VHEKCAQLLPDGAPGAERIGGEQTDERDGQDTDDPWSPVQDFVGCFHGDFVIILKQEQG